MKESLSKDDGSIIRVVPGMSVNGDPFGEGRKGRIMKKISVGTDSYLAVAASTVDVEFFVIASTSALMSQGKNQQIHLR